MTLFCVLFPLRHQSHSTSLAEYPHGNPDCVSQRVCDSVCLHGKVYVFVTCVCGGEKKLGRRNEQNCTFSNESSN